MQMQQSPEGTNMEGDKKGRPGWQSTLKHSYELVEQGGVTRCCSLPLTELCNITLASSRSSTPWQNKV